MSSTVHEALIQECRDLFRDRLIEAVQRTFDGMDKSLMELADKCTVYEQRNRYLDARDVALSNREVIESQFRRRLMLEFQSRVEETKERANAKDVSLDELSLVGHEALNETLSFNDLAAKMRRHCEEEMQALDQRVAVLLGRPGIEADQNPFGAKVVADAFKQACQQIDCPLEVRLVFLKSFEALALEGIRGTCREVNDVLVANAVLPKIRYGVQRREGSAKPAPAAAAAATPALAPVPPTPASKPQDIFSMLSQLLGGPTDTGVGEIALPLGSGAQGSAGSGAPAGAGGGGNGNPTVPSGFFRDLTGFTEGGAALGAGGAPLVAGAQLMGSLTQLQRGDASMLDEVAAAELAPILAGARNMENVLRRLKDTRVGAGMGHMDAMTLEIVSMIFDALFDDAKVPLAIKGLIGRLQLPMLKVAIADKDLFSSKQHPARRLLDAIGQLGSRLPRDLAADSAAFKQVEALIDTLVDGFQENTEIFEATRLQLEAMIAAEDARIALQMQATQRELEQIEKLALAKAEVQEDLRARVAAHPGAPAAVLEFLSQQWIKHLVVVRARDGAESDAWRVAAETVDKLLWSVEPKPTIEDHRALTRSIPPLLRELKAGVAAAGIDAAVSAEFFSQLMGCHTTAMRAATTVPVPDAAAAPGAAQPAAEDALDFTQSVSVANPFGDGQVEVNDNDLDFTGGAATGGRDLTLVAPAQQPARAPRAARQVRLPLAMVVGAWVSVQDRQTDEVRAGRLHYVSPLKSHFLFVDRQGNKVYECSRTMLAKRLALEEIVMLDGEPDSSLFDRIMDGLFGKLLSRTQPSSAGPGPLAGLQAPIALATG